MLEFKAKSHRKPPLLLEAVHSPQPPINPVSGGGVGGQRGSQWLFIFMYKTGGNGGTLLLVKITQ